MYVVLKHLHLTQIAGAVLMFILRFYWLQTGSALAEGPHPQDQRLAQRPGGALRCCSAWCWVSTPQQRHPRLAEKLTSILVVAFLAMMALRLARSNGIRWFAFLGALGWIFFIAKLAGAKAGQPVRLGKDDDDNVDEWTDFEAHDLAELALSVSDEIRGHGGTGEAELARLDAWLDAKRLPRRLRRGRRQLLQGFYQTRAFVATGRITSRPPAAIWTRCWQGARDPGEPWHPPHPAGSQDRAGCGGDLLPAISSWFCRSGRGEVYVDPFNGDELSRHRIELLLRGALGNLASLSDDHLQPSGQWESSSACSMSARAPCCARSA